MAQAEAPVAGGSTVDERAWTNEEKASLADYQGNGYADLNDFLRHDPGGVPLSQEDMIWNLDTMINGSRLVNDGVFYRGTLLEHFQGVEPGSIVEDPAFMSTSSDIGVAKAHAFKSPDIDLGMSAAILRINAKAGSRAVEMNKVLGNKTMHANEKEFLFGRSTKLRFDGVTVAPETFLGETYHIIDVTVVD